MRRLSRAPFLPAALAGLAVLLSAGCAGSPVPEPELKPVVEAMTERGWSRGEVEVFDSTLAGRVAFHYAGSTRELTREELAGTVLAWREAFPDLELRVDQLIREGDLVAGRFTLSGTHRGPWRGAEPTGRRATMALMMFFRFEDGRVVELWEADDQLGFREQLGLLSR